MQIVVVVVTRLADFSLESPREYFPRIFSLQPFDHKFAPDHEPVFDLGPENIRTEERNSMRAAIRTELPSISTEGIKMLSIHVRLALVSLALVFGIVVANEANKELLERLCRHDPSVPAITDEQVVRALAIKLKFDESVECPENVAEAIKKLRLVLLKDRSNSFNDLRFQFMEDYITIDNEQGSASERILPIQLQEFFMKSFPKLT